jgi:hypothetical protein
MKTKMNRTWTSLLTASLMSLTINAHAATLLVGSYTDGASQGIYRYGSMSATATSTPRPSRWSRRQPFMAGAVGRPAPAVRGQ